MIQYEAANTGDPEMLGLARAIGIEKGKPFKPDARMQKVLAEAAKLANAAFRGVMYKPRNPDVYFYPDRKWYSLLAAGSHEFLDANGARALDDRIGFHFYATGITPFMVTPAIGKGSVYEIGSMNQNGDMLDGGKTYAVTLPGPIPARSFWSFMAYDNHTRSILETDQKTGGVDSKLDGISVTAYDSAKYLIEGAVAINSYSWEVNDDKSVTVSFNCGDDAINNIDTSAYGKDFTITTRHYGATQEVINSKFDIIIKGIK